MGSASCSKSTLQGLEAALVVTERAAGDRGERFCRIAAIKLTRLSRRRWTPSVPQLPQRVLNSPQIDRERASISPNNRLQFWCPESIAACDPGTGSAPAAIESANHRRERLVTHPCLSCIVHRNCTLNRLGLARNILVYLPVHIVSYRGSAEGSVGLALRAHGEFIPGSSLPACR